MRAQSDSCYGTVESLLTGNVTERLTPCVLTYVDPGNGAPEMPLLCAMRPRSTRLTLRYPADVGPPGPLAKACSLAQSHHTAREESGWPSEGSYFEGERRGLRRRCHHVSGTNAAITQNPEREPQMRQREGCDSDALATPRRFAIFIWRTDGNAESYA